MEQQHGYPSVMSQAAYAQYLGTRYGKKMSRQAVHKSAVIPKLPGGKIDRAAADAALIHHGHLAHPMELNLTPAAEPPASLQAESPSGTGKRGGGGYYAEKAETERVIRRLKELELGEKEGALRRVPDIEEAMVTAGRRIAERLEALVMIADELQAAASKDGVTGVRAVLRREVRAIRDDLAEELSRAASDQAREGEGDDDDAEDGT